MRKLSVVLTLFLVIGLGAAPVQAQGFMNEPGSIIVFPLIDNINGITIVTISNLAGAGTDPVTLECWMVTHGTTSTAIDGKTDFNITLKPNQAFFWNTAAPHPSGSPEGFGERKGFLFCFAVDGPDTGVEIAHNFLIGSANVLNTGGIYAWGYNAIPHQALAVVGNRVLNLDDVEYTTVTSTVFFDGLAAVPGSTPPPDFVFDGVFVVANLDMDLTVPDGQPALTLNFACWDSDDVDDGKISRHTYPAHQTFAQYRLSESFLDLTPATLGTLGFHCSVTGGADDKPIWAVFGQNFLIWGWGSNVKQVPGAGAPATITLPPLPVGP